jgi:hypothetical protein
VSCWQCGLPVAPAEAGAETYQGETWMLDSPEGVCPGQAGFEYPATFVLFSMRLFAMKRGSVSC